tara:strand:+ start:820 stop:1524 length:705 start_codon:yes stop_codon:yes gene_type:complete
MTTAFKPFKKSSRRKIYLILISMSLFCFGLSIFRVYLSGSKDFLFLNWNLFLASIPFLASSYLRVQEHKKWKTILILILWLLFFPNAPYILTDLFHLRVLDSAPIWFDTILILSFAWTGLIFGFISLIDISKISLQWIRQRWLNPIVGILLFLTAYGIYIGRFLRWNSWDLISHPLSLLYDLALPIIHPMDHPRAWGMTLLLGCLLNMIYWSSMIWKNTFSNLIFDQEHDPRTF